MYIEEYKQQSNSVVSSPLVLRFVALSMLMMEDLPTLGMPMTRMLDSGASERW